MQLLDHVKMLSLLTGWSQSYTCWTRLNRKQVLDGASIMLKSGINSGLRILLEQFKASVFSVHCHHQCFSSICLKQVIPSLFHRKTGPRDLVTVLHMPGGRHRNQNRTGIFENSKFCYQAATISYAICIHATTDLPWPEGHKLLPPYIRVIQDWLQSGLKVELLYKFSLFNHALKTKEIIWCLSVVR